MNLSSYVKLDNVKQFSNSTDEDNDYKPKQGYIKFFSSNNGTILSSESVDGGEDKTFIAFENNTIAKEVTEDELNDFVEKLKYMAALGDSYNYLDFYNLNESAPEVKQFSVKIREYLKEKTRQPRIAFMFRIRQFITYMNKTKVDNLGFSLYYAVQYIKEFFEQYLTAAMNGIVNPNIMMGLGISRFVSKKQSIRMLQKWLRKAATEIENTGVMTKLTQRRLWDSFRDAFLELMTGISYKIKEPIKRDMLISAVSGSAKELNTTVEGLIDVEEDNAETA